MWSCCKLSPLADTVSTSTDVAQTIPTFTATPGPHLQLPSNPHPVDFLEELLDEDILGLVVDETNKYVTIHIHHYYCLLLDCWLHINNMHNVAQHIISAIFHMHRYASEKISKLETEGKLTRRSQSHSTGPLKRIDKVRYSGRETLDEANSEYQALPQPSQVVLHLLEPYLDQGQHVFTDRYYTSIPLAKTLKSTTFTETTGSGSEFRRQH